MEFKKQQKLMGKAMPEKASDKFGQRWRMKPLQKESSLIMNNIQHRIGMLGCNSKQNSGRAFRFASALLPIP